MTKFLTPLNAVTSFDIQVQPVYRISEFQIFQAKDLTLLQKKNILVLLSKWALWDAWFQLANINNIGFLGKCKVEIEALDTVVRRMSDFMTETFFTFLRFVYLMLSYITNMIDGIDSKRPIIP